MKAKDLFRKVSQYTACINIKDKNPQYHLCSYCEDALIKFKERKTLNTEAVCRTRLGSKNEELKSIIRQSLHSDTPEGDREILKALQEWQLRTLIKRINVND